MYKGLIHKKCSRCKRLGFKEEMVKVVRRTFTGSAWWPTIVSKSWLHPRCIEGSSWDRRIR